MTMEMTAPDFVRLERQAEEAVRKLGLPANPEILGQIGAELRRESPQVRRIGDLVARDVAAAAVILRMVNASAHRTGCPARSVQQAVAFLGFDHTARLLGRLLARDAFPRCVRPSMPRLWRDAARLAHVASCLGRLLGVAAPDEAHTYGLFRDAGSAVLMSRHADYDAIMAEYERAGTISRTDHEKAWFGVDHAVIGAVLARDRHLPEEVSDAILWHHADFVLALEDPPIRREAVRLIALGVLGDRVLAYAGESERELRPAGGFEQALRLFGLDEHAFADVRSEALARLAEWEGRPAHTLRMQRVPA